MKLEVRMRILMGGTYRYIRDLPAGCKGAHYIPHRVIKDLPSYQEKILVEALDGIDAGLFFCCTPANFAERYELVEEVELKPESLSAPEPDLTTPTPKSYDLTKSGSGH